ncbi:hypothetical protein [Rhodococcus gannanensis]|uniref:Short chain dehydrogenase n=1 Tax=Rhodococcus gannanensis TaxID=1960308 RepID=A0ABW4P3N6_9NOCA
MNHLGHLALLRELLPGMTRPARVVFVTSGTHNPDQLTGMPRPLRIDVDALAYPPEPSESAQRDGRRRYSTSKLANLMTSCELDRRLADDGVTVNVFDPGLMPGTGLARDAGPVARTLWRSVVRGLVALPGVHTPARSGTDLARLVTDPTLDGVTGRHVVGRRERRSSEDSYDRETQRALYDDSMRLLDTLVR